MERDRPGGQPLLPITQIVRGDVMRRHIDDVTAAAVSEAAMAVTSKSLLLQLLPEKSSGPQRNLSAAASFVLPDYVMRLLPGPCPPSVS